MAVAVVAAAVWLLIPIARSPETPITEKFLNIVYPLADIFLVIPAIAIALSCGRSLLGEPRRLICAGLILLGIADFSFSYLSWNELYWADVNSPGNFIDLLWMGGYLAIGAGAFYYDQMLSASP